MQQAIPFPHELLKGAVAQNGLPGLLRRYGQISHCPEFGSMAHDRAI